MHVYNRRIYKLPRVIHECNSCETKLHTISLDCKSEALTLHYHALLINLIWIRITFLQQLRRYLVQISFFIHFWHIPTYWFHKSQIFHITPACDNWHPSLKLTTMKKRSERRKHCALAVVRRNQKFAPRRRPPSRGRRTDKTTGDGHYLYLPTQFGEDRCTQFRVIVVRPTDRTDYNTLRRS